MSSDGRRVLVPKTMSDRVANRYSIAVTLNWFEELKRRVPTGR